MPAYKCTIAIPRYDMPYQNTRQDLGSLLGLHTVKSGTYDVASIVFILYEGVVQPDELLMLTDNRELILLKVRERAL